MSKYDKHSLKKLREAVVLHSGFVSPIAEALGVTRKTINEWKNNHPEFLELFEDAKEKSLDITETKLNEAIEKGEGWAICFKLKCHGKNRGYIEKEIVVSVDLTKEDIRATAKEMGNSVGGDNE